MAIDFTATSCDGNEHHLYAELDAGKVVVLEFVMLVCAPCIVATKAIEKIIEPYESTNPGRVKLYSFGFLDSYTCDNMMAWKTSNSFTHEVFAKGEEMLSYYDQMGMPTTVVLGTAGHKVFYEALGYTPTIGTEMSNAIETALTESSLGIDDPVSDLGISVYPTFFSDEVFVDASKLSTEAVVDFYSTNGLKVKSVSINAGAKLAIPTSELPSGMYLLKIQPKEINQHNKNIIQSIKLIKN